MSIKHTVDRILGRDTDEPEEDPREPSHVCESCGEEYYTNPEMEIHSCRECGGVKVEPV